MRLALAFLLLLGAGLSGCSYDEDDAGNIDLVSLGGPVGVSVGENDDDPHQPIYNWDSQSPARELRVIRGDVNDDDVVWGIQTNTADATMTSPVVHGHTNPGTNEFSDTELQLEPDVRYTVVIETQTVDGTPQPSWAEFRLTE